MSSISASVVHRWRVVVLTVLAAVAGAAPGADLRRLSLNEAVALAIANNPQIGKAREEIMRATGQVVEFSAARLPSVSAGAGGQVEDRSRFETQPGYARTEQGSWNLGARVRQTVYAGGRISGNIRIATLQRQEAVATLDAVVQDIVLGVETHFYEALRQRALVGVAEEQIRLLAEELADQQKRSQAGSVPEFNVLRARVELANAQPDLIRAKNAHRIAVAELARLVAIEAKAGPGLPFDVTGALTTTAARYDLGSALTTALAQRSELDALEIRAAAARQEISVEAAGLKPEVSVFGGYDFLSEQFRGPSHATSGAIVGLQAEWKIFDFGATRGRMDQARAKARQVELDLEDTRRQIELEVRKAWSRYLEARELIDSQQQNVEVALESLRQARVRFDAGGSTQLDVLAAQTALTEARTNELQARADLSQSLSELRRAMGVLAPVAASGEPAK